MSHYLRFAAALAFAAALIYVDLQQKAFGEARGAMSWLLVPFRVAATLPGDGIRNFRDYTRARADLLQENAELERLLREDKIKLKSLDFYLRENAQLRRLLELDERQAGDWLTAEVARNVSQGAARRVFLNRGIGDGVVPGMAVVNDVGVLGQVIRADVNTSAVGQLTDPGQWISTRARRTNLLVILRGNGDGRMIIEYVANDADLQEGDILEAAGGLFPPGYPVAEVEQLEPGVVYQIGVARPLTDFSSSPAALLYFSADNAPQN